MAGVRTVLCPRCNHRMRSFSDWAADSSLLIQRAMIYFCRWCGHVEKRKIEEVKGP